MTLCFRSECKEKMTKYRGSCCHTTNKSILNTSHTTDHRDAPNKEINEMLFRNLNDTRDEGKDERLLEDDIRFKGWFRVRSGSVPIHYLTFSTYI